MGKMNRKVEKKNMNYDYCNGKIHTIQTGDTLYKISGMYRVPLALILRANPYVDIYNLQVGEKLCIPGGFDNETKPPKPSNPICPGGDCNTGDNNNRPSRPGGSVSVFLYVIKDVQSIRDILDKFGITLEELLQENNLGNIMVQPGTAVRIPGNEEEVRRAIEEMED